MISKYNKVSLLQDALLTHITVSGCGYKPHYSCVLDDLSQWKVESGEWKVTQTTTSPLAGEVCFQLEMKLKARKQGKGYNPTQVENYPFLEHASASGSHYRLETNNSQKDSTYLSDGEMSRSDREGLIREKHLNNTRHLQAKLGDPSDESYRDCYVAIAPRNDNKHNIPAPTGDFTLDFQACNNTYRLGSWIEKGWGNNPKGGNPC